MKSHEITMKSHEITMKSHEMTMKSHEITMKSHEITMKSHEMTMKSHEITMKSHEIPSFVLLPLHTARRNPRLPQLCSPARQGSATHRLRGRLELDPVDGGGWRAGSRETMGFYCNSWKMEVSWNGGTPKSSIFSSISLGEFDDSGNS